MTEKIDATDGVERLEETPENQNNSRSFYIGDAQWDKLAIVRGELGNWNRFVDVAIEQLLASGLISQESREAIHSINRRYGIDYLDDTSWRGAFKIREPWPEASSHLRVIDETLKEINAGLGSLAQTVEDHATTMLEAELVKPDGSDI